MSERRLPDLHLPIIALARIQSRVVRRGARGPSVAGWVRSLRKAMQQAKRSHRARRKRARFESSGWQWDGGLARRRYESYEAYVEHQSSKLPSISERLHRREAECLAGFMARFRACQSLAAASSVLCLGARIGTEVKALHALGHLAIGVDLNPGPLNSYVLPGDFHYLVFPDACSDAVYTNCLDHVFDLPRMLAEVRRVLRPGGVFVTDVKDGSQEGGLAGDFEATHWASSHDLILRICELTGFTVEGSPAPVGKRMLEVVLRKPPLADAAPDGRPASGWTNTYRTPRQSGAS